MHPLRSAAHSLRRLAGSALAFGALALASPFALAQPASRHFVFMSDGSWGAAQDAAIRSAGGAVDASHPASGIGFASSSRPGFLGRALQSGAFSGGSEDMVVRWQDPSEPQAIEEAPTDQSVAAGDDTYIHALWNLTAIHAQDAWALGYDGAGVRVAVIDGGMCSQHPDLAPNLDVAASASFVPGFAWDQDTGNPTTFRHACHVAGIIAAADNAIGTLGVAPRATIIGLKVLHGGRGSFRSIIEAILYASDPIRSGGAGARIINMSLGATFALGGGDTGAGPLLAAMSKAVNYATAHGVLVVVAAGNDALDLDHTGSVIDVPSQSGTALSISATAPTGFAVGWPNGATDFDTPASYTNYGRSAIWMSAPGGDNDYSHILTCRVPLVPSGSVTRSCRIFDNVLSPGSQSGSYFFAAGTSMAAPHVSGVAALVVQKDPRISVGELKNRLKNSALDAGATGVDPYHGFGFLDAYGAVSR